ncbi:MAG: hypothetical protein GX942_00450 [Papillibacter sp.]|nr:hypothetical protein [Papillibacter sp.]
MADMEKILAALKNLRIGMVIEEYDLQASVAEVLTAYGIAYKKEYYLGLGNRVDFMTEDGIAIEIKKGKPNRTRLINQIERYAVFDEVAGIIVVVETSLRIPPTKTISGKPCAILGLKKLWGIAL